MDNINEKELLYTPKKIINLRKEIEKEVKKIKDERSKPKIYKTIQNLFK